MSYEKVARASSDYFKIIAVCLLGNLLWCFSFLWCEEVVSSLFVVCCLRSVFPASGCESEVKKAIKTHQTLMSKLIV